MAVSAITATAAIGWWVSAGSAANAIHPGASAAARVATAPGPAQAAQRTVQPAHQLTSATPGLGLAQGVGQRAAIDPATGQLRPLEHDDVQTTRSSAGLALAPQRRAGASGSVILEVPEELHTFTVATRGPGGQIAIEHVSGGKAAAAKTRTASKGRPIGASGVANDR